MISYVDIEINKNEISALSLFVDLMEKNMIFHLLFHTKVAMILCVCRVITMWLLLLLLLLFTYKSWMGFMQINTTNDGQLCLISDFSMLCHHQTIKPYRMRSYIVWVPFTFPSSSRVYWIRSKTIDCYLSKRFIIDIVCLLTIHIGMLACLLAFFSKRPRCGDWFGEMSISPKRWFSCAFDQKFGPRADESSNAAFSKYRMIQRSASHYAICVYPLTIIRKRTMDPSIADANCIAFICKKIEL